MVALKRFFLYICIITLLILCFRNYISTTSQFIYSNISIRDSFYQKNEGFFDANNDGELDFVKKGTHDGGENYFIRINSYINLIKNLDHKNLILLLKKITKFNIENTQFLNEHKLVHKLIEYSKMKNDEKKRTAIFIPRDNKTYWNISCDSLMIPFIVPAISNISNILAIPTKPWSKSCFGQFSGYGYGVYLNLYENEIPNENINYSNAQICNAAKKYYLNQIIKLYFKNNDIVEERFTCI